MANPIAYPDTLVDSSSLKTALKSVINDILPTISSTTHTYVYESTSTNLPEPLKASYLTTRAVLLTEIESSIDTLSIRPITDNEVSALNTYNWLKDIFIEVGRCHRVNYHNENGTGRQLTPEQLIAQGYASPAIADGIFTYFKTSFTLDSNYGSVAAANNGYKNTTMYQTIPANTTNWNNNTRITPNTTQSQTLSINQLIDSVNAMNSQLNLFDAEWNNKSTNPYWWNGDASDVSNVSNRIFFVRYWCHNNCHNNCHHERNRR